MEKNNDQEGGDALSGTGQRLRAVAEQLHGGNKSELARSLGMQPSSFAKYTDGRRRPGAVVLEKLSRLGININWLISGEGSMLERGNMPPNAPSLPSQPKNNDQQTDTATHAQSESDETLHRIPLVRIRESAKGELRLVETGSSEWVAQSFVRRQYGVVPELLRDFRISGNSMGDTIRPGDRVRTVLCQCHSPSDGTVCILQSPISLHVRRLRFEGTKVLLVADHSEIPDQTLDQEQWEKNYEPIARILEVRQPL